MKMSETIATLIVAIFGLACITVLGIYVIKSIKDISRK